MAPYTLIGQMIIQNIYFYGKMYCIYEYLRHGPRGHAEYHHGFEHCI